MTVARPTSVADLAAIVPSQQRWHIRGGGTKPALSSAPPGGAVLDLTSLAGILEYTPEECTFTALAGTRIADIERALAPHRQHLPFDPPLTAAGATLGGTVAAGVNGSGRYRFGGVRDFLIGVRVVDGEGRVVRSGGKVVKNAAGFLLHQAMVGSCGELGVLAELTFKVFPAAEAHATLRVETGDLATALAAMAAVQRERFDLEAIDIAAPGTLWLRLGGFTDALDARVRALLQVVGERTAVMTADEDAAIWRGAREFGWVSGESALVRVPVTATRVQTLDAALGGYGAARRYSVAGNLAWVSWPGSVWVLDALLRDLDLVGQVLTGAADRPFIGAITANPFEERVRSIMDPQGRFRAASHSA